MFACLAESQPVFFAFTEISWQVEEVLRKENTLELKVLITSSTIPTTENSPQYVINDTVSVQLRMIKTKTSNIFPPCPSGDTLFVLFKFASTRRLDRKTYSVNVSSDKEKINKTFLTDDQSWRLVFSDSKNNINFNVKLVVNLYVTTSPFATIYEDTTFTDLKLAGSDGYVEMHAAALAAHSPVFKKVLNEKARESSGAHTIEMPGVKKSTLLHLKDYIYLRSVPDVEVQRLLLLATEYTMPELTQLCMNKLMSAVNVENVFEMLEFSLENEINDISFSILDLIQNGEIQVSDVRNFCAKIDMVISSCTYRTM